MKFRKNWKRFWTLDRHHAEGFTLVELIVVIAILAILAGVGTVGYSGYVKKANIAADEALFAEIETAIRLAYYANPGTSYAGYIILSGTDNATTSGGSLDSAMEDAFGTSWSTTLKLKYTDGWTSASYLNSSFAGSETALLTRVDDLTEVLKEFLTSNSGLAGDNFNTYLEKIGVNSEDTSAVADAAVLYVASTSSGDINRDKAVEYMSTLWKNGQLNSEAMSGGGLTSCFGSDLAAAASVYAMFEAYCRYEAKQNNTAPLNKLNESEFVLTNNNALATVLTVVNGVITDGTVMNGCDPTKYFGTEKAVTDAEAYLDLMTTVNAAESQITNLDTALGSENFFSNATLTNLFTAVAEGGALIMVSEEDGLLNITLPTLN